MKHRHKALRSYPFRIGCVESLRLEPRNGLNNGIAISLIDILHLLSPHLRHLSLLPLPLEPEEGLDPPDPIPTPDEEAAFQCNVFLEMLGSVSKFPKLTSLAIALRNDSGIKPLDILFPRCPKLQRLDVCSAEEDFADLELPFISLWKPTPSLTHLAFAILDDSMDEMSSRLLGFLVRAAPNLGYLKVAGEWDPVIGDSTFQSIRDMKELGSMVFLTGTGHVQHLRGNKGLGKVVELMTEEDDMDEAGELDFEVSIGHQFSTARPANMVWRCRRAIMLIKF